MSWLRMLRRCMEFDRLGALVTSMNMPNDGFLLVVKRNCPTCRLIIPIARALSKRGMLAGLVSQDDPAFPVGMAVTDDRELENSFESDTRESATVSCGRRMGTADSV